MVDDSKPQAISQISQFSIFFSAGVHPSMHLLSSITVLLWQVLSVWRRIYKRLKATTVFLKLTL